jgi:hypothetical protein
MKRLGAASGIVYSVFVAVGLILLFGAEIDQKTDQEILSHYADSGNRTLGIVGFMLVTVGVLFFLWFLSTLQSRLASVEPEPRTYSVLAFGAGVSAAALLVGAVAVMTGTHFAVELASEFVVDPNLARFAISTSYLFLFGSVLVNVVLVIVTSVQALRTAVLPNWVGWAGFAAVVLAVVEAFLLPVFVVPVWVVVVSVVLMVNGPTSDPQAT